MKKSVFALFIGVLSATPSFAGANALYAQLKKEIPEGTYIGKRHDGSQCQIIVSEVSNPTYRNLYVIKTVFTDSGKTQTFELRKTDEIFIDISAGDSDKKIYGWVGGVNKNPDFLKNPNDRTRTRMSVGRGKKSSSSETYYEGYDKELHFWIEERAKQRGFKGPAWRVFVGATNWGKVGAGGLTCHIEPLHK